MSDGVMLIAISTPNPEELEAVQSYVSQVLPMLTAAGGKSPRRMKITETLAGSSSLNCFTMEFASADAVKAVFESDEYQALIPTRDKGFAQMNIVIAEDM